MNTNSNSQRLENINFFIDMFSAIPDENWNTDGGYYKREDETKSCACALGHCMNLDRNNWNDSGPFFNHRSVTAAKLRELFNNEGSIVTYINDYKSEAYPQETPKLRILAALNDLKNKIN